MPSALYIREEDPFMCGFKCTLYIIRIACQSIDRFHGNHAADCVFRVNFMSAYDSFGRCHKLVVGTAVHGKFRVFLFGIQGTGIRPAKDIIVLTLHTTEVVGFLLLRPLHCLKSFRQYVKALH